MGIFKRLRMDEMQEREEGLLAWAKSLEGVTLIRDSEDRQVVKVAGVVERVKVQPRDAPASFEATLTDGTGEVRAVWMGRRGIPGMKLGSRLMLSGRLGRDQRGRLQLVNPVYELEASSY